jgi:AcrR family transcriptional regulator
MSPRGVAIPEVRLRLFQAAERVLEKDGPAALSGRAVTREAGYATGLLYNHFGTFDDFLVEFVLDRTRARTEKLRALPDRAGEATVAENIAEAAGSLLDSNMLAVGGLVMTRPALLTRLGRELAGGGLRLHESERAFADYLEAEQALGRVNAAADTEAAALAILGAVHQLVLTHGTADPDLPARTRKVVLGIVAAFLPTP